jgi:urea transporter
MERLLAKWKSLCESSRVLRFVDINLRGIGQVMFQDNPLTGAFFLVAIAWGSYAAGVPQVAIAGVVAVIVATLTAQWLHVDDGSLNAGLYGFNGILVGLALATFLAPGPLLWVYVLLGAAVSVVAMLATTNVVKPWGALSHFRSCSQRGFSCWPRMDFPASREQRCRPARLSPRSNPTRQTRSS